MCHHQLTRAAVYAQTSGARILTPSNTSRLPVGNVNFSIRAPPLAGSGMVMQLLVNDFHVSDVVEDTAVILNDMPEAWCVPPFPRFSIPHSSHVQRAVQVRGDTRAATSQHRR